eukprot:c14163_g1_i1.p2 GENE.c14163_g1_i1~~c14163_g1_i1.p2  ORF type:complete len:145 (+),score=21.48 c14163_g1_i1:744-1178(+)
MFDCSLARRGTLEYASPEVLKNDIEDPFKVDVWSCGVLLFFLLTASLPFTGTGALDMPLQIPVHLPASAHNLLVRMLTKDAMSRATLQEVEQHSFLHGNLDIQSSRRNTNQHAVHKSMSAITLLLSNMALFTQLPNAGSRPVSF